MGRVSARTDLGGVYAALLREGDPGGTLRRGTVVWRSYHDTGKHEVVEAREDFAAQGATLDGADLHRDVAKEKGDSAKYADAWTRGGGGVLLHFPE